MSKEIRLYVEGGGDTAETKGRLRLGVSEFLRPVIDSARAKRYQFQVVMCGSRGRTFDAFITALETHPEAVNVLVVDAEAPVTATPWAHLKARDNWDDPGVGDNRCHLMCQAMEAWFVADIATLNAYYGAGFNANAIPKHTNVDAIPKDDLEPCLISASKHTQKGRYHKTKHAPELLERLDRQRVRTASAHCDRLFNLLEQELA